MRAQLLSLSALITIACAGRDPPGGGDGRVPVPRLCASPERVDFGAVEVGEVVARTVTLTSCGDAEVAIFDLAVDDAPFVIETAAAFDMLSPGQAIDIVVLFAPSETGAFDGALIVSASDPTGGIEIALAGVAEPVPCASAALDVIGDDVISAYGTAHLSALGSAPSPGATEIISYQWWLVDDPSFGMVEDFGDGTAEFAAALVGSHVVAVDVLDDLGRVACTPALATVRVVADGDVYIELFWDHGDADLDLHVVRGDGALFAHSDDVYFSNREPEPVPPWSSNPDENPRLERDDSHGYGPESTTIVSLAPDACFTAAVHYWNAQTDVDPSTSFTVRIHVEAELRVDVTETFGDEELLYTVAEVCRPGNGTPTVTLINAVQGLVRPF